MNKIILDYGDFPIQCSVLINQIKKHKEFKYLKYVYGIPTGGLPLAVHLSKHLNLKLILDINDFKKDMGMILICDDILDSGKTMEDFLFDNFHCDFCKGVSLKYLIAVLYFKQKSIIKPDFNAETVKLDEWIVFPWELNDSPTKRDCDL